MNNHICTKKRFLEAVKKNLLCTMPRTFVVNTSIANANTRSNSSYWKNIVNHLFREEKADLFEFSQSVDFILIDYFFVLLNQDIIFHGRDSIFFLCNGQIKLRTGPEKAVSRISHIQKLQKLLPNYNI